MSRLARRSRRSASKRIVELLLLAVIATAVVTSAAAVELSFPWAEAWTDVVVQSLAYTAATLLCLMRKSNSPSGRAVQASIVAAVMLFGLSNIGRNEAVVRALDLLPVAVLSHAQRAAFYICVFLAIVLLMRTGLHRRPLTRAFDGLVIGFGAVTTAALVAAVLGRVYALPATTFVPPVVDVLLLTLIAGTMLFFCSPPRSSLLLISASLLAIGFADCIYAAELVSGSHTFSGLSVAAYLIAVTALALTPGRDEGPRTTRMRAVSMSKAVVPLIAAMSVISALMAATYADINPLVGYLAVATLLAALGRQATVFSEARHAGEQAHLAQTDELTALLNRRGFYNQAATVLSDHGSNGSTPKCALLLADLNHFKDFNDSLGHAAGDELLRTVAARIRESLRDEDIVARLGGDEFAILLPHTCADRAVPVADALNRALEKSVVLDGLHVQTGASVGIAISPEHGRDLGTLLRHADIAMYRAKQGQGRHLVYTSEADEPATTRCGMKLLAQLRQAIAQGELVLHYQPKLCMATGEIVGMEALVRWHHPERGLLYPGQFLPLVRHNALMYAMNELVFQQALDDAADWHSRGYRVPVAINLFPPTLADVDLPARLDNALHRKGLTPSALAVEVTEEFLLDNLNRGRHVLDGLHRLGVTIAIDNFGNGSSSLNHFRHLPIDEIKLDRSLCASVTEDPRAAAILRSVIDLCRTLGVRTVAEGVESPAIAAMLTGYGCDFAQGHYYYQPLTAAETLDVLAELADAEERHESATARFAVAMAMLASHAGNGGSPVGRHMPAFRPVSALRRRARPHRRGQEP
ncbi:putative bifunctional diguanylate cyclase/phosphodiesterase [Mycolicibacterium agri]|nr:EAL domain-containing protein [Mycolicibacterium agri]